MPGWWFTHTESPALLWARMPLRGLTPVRAILRCLENNRPSESTWGVQVIVTRQSRSSNYPLMTITFLDNRRYVGYQGVVLKVPRVDTVDSVCNDSGGPCGGQIENSDKPMTETEILIRV